MTLVVAIVAIAAIALVVVILRRTMRLTAVTLGVSAGVSIAIVVGALLVGGSLTQPSPAVADDASERATAVVDPAVLIQLPTLGLDD